MNSQFIYIIIIIFVYIIYVMNKYISRYFLFKRYHHVMKLFSQCRDICYLHIYRTEIKPIFDNNASLRKNDRWNIFYNDYIKMVWEMCGKNLQNDLISIFGSKDQIINYISLEFLERVRNDEYNVYEDISTSNDV